MHHAWIGLGSNLGPGIAILHAAWEELGHRNKIATLALASPYCTAPVEMASEHLFTNSAGLLATSLAPEGLLDVLLEIEARFGRHRPPSGAVRTLHEDRPLDLDLLCYDDMVLQGPRLTLPHPRMHQRLFVLTPLAEISPTLVIPGTDLPVSRVLARVAAVESGFLPRRLAWRPERIGG
ncbi:MAG: 2-amino-4-hydroxy-6-hydroxymethyldihydropteridine diphosphokinase [Desulfobulbaceae bacterium A2]|nr:MAG: 2-amino-4-hydroxy-6-hydroxymethyldihydropteridine diphosphokinase [Desulfobulbaceae bacterium A2]